MEPIPAPNPEPEPPPPPAAVDADAIPPAAGGPDAAGGRRDGAWVALLLGLALLLAGCALLVLAAAGRAPG